MKLKQRQGDRSREVALQPFSRAANVNKLERAAFAQMTAYISTPMDGQADERESVVLPVLLICDDKPEHMLKTNPG